MMLAEPIQITGLIAKVFEQLKIPYFIGGSLARGIGNRVSAGIGNRVRPTQLTLNK
jgi:hypothetical protein